LFLLTFVWLLAIINPSVIANYSLDWARFSHYSSFIPSLVMVSLLQGVLGYGILSLFKTRLNKIISVIYLSLLLLTYALLLYSSNGYLWLIRTLLSFLIIILFFVNAVFTIYYKLYDKNKRLDD
jgi:hypothetical protein